jgi:hypothetical protein
MKYGFFVGQDSVVAMGWTVRELNPGGGEIFRTRPDRPKGAHPASCTMNTGSLSLG